MPTTLSSPSTSRGLFIALEGGDGAGKSTQVEALARWLRTARSRTVMTTREPGGTPMGASIRSLVLHRDHVDPRAEALLYAADRAHHVATLVRPALGEGQIVVTDRYVDSSIAYQGAGRALDPDDIARISAWATQGLVPDLTVLLDVDPRAGASRRGDALPDRLERESLDFHEAVRRRFLELAVARPDGYLVLPADQEVAVISRAVRERVEGMLDEEPPGAARDLRVDARWAHDAPPEPGDAHPEVQVDLPGARDVLGGSGGDR